VRPGYTISTRWTVLEKLDKPKQQGGIIVMRGESKNQKSEVTVEAEGKILVATRPS
jgi:acyl dehydratase